MTEETKEKFRLIQKPHLAGGKIDDTGIEAALSKSGHLSMESGEEDAKEEKEVNDEEAKETKDKIRWIQRLPLTLRRINLGWNTFQDAGVISLCNALELYDGIQILDLRGCDGIGRDGYEKLGALLAHHRTLNTLILSESKSDEESDFVSGVSYLISFEDVHHGNCLTNFLFKFSKYLDKYLVND